MPTLREYADLLNRLSRTDDPGDLEDGDLRDFLFSMKRPHGSIEVTVAAETSIAEAGTYYKAAGTTTLCGDTEHYLFDMPAMNRLRYTGVTDCHAHIACTIAMTTAGTNDVLAFKLAKNGSVIDHSASRRFVGTGSDIGSTALHSDLMLSQNDYLEMWVTNESAAAGVTIENMYLFALGMFV